MVSYNLQVSYPHRVHFTDGVFHPANDLLAEVLAQGGVQGRSRVLVVAEETLATVRPGFLELLTSWFHRREASIELCGSPLLVPGGERIKNSLDGVTKVLEAIDLCHIDRHSYVAAIGGGALLDMAGFASAIAHRGVRHIRLPTTTLSQCDSGVGVKNGVNAFGKKNSIGTFAPPFAVVNDFAFIDSLEPRDHRAGYAEAVKVALIRDRLFFEWIGEAREALRTFEAAAVRRLIQQSAELHLRHIATCGDPFEHGSARPLDFGHWAAHKLEPLSGYRLRHGEAVAVGVALDSIYSRRMGFLSTVECDRILELLEALGFSLNPVELTAIAPDGRLAVLAGLEEFREHLGGELTITLLKGIGQGFETHEMMHGAIEASVAEIAGRSGNQARA